MSVRAALLGLVALVCSLTHAVRAHACSCVESGGVKEVLAASGSVFEGKVLELRHDPARHRLTARVAVTRQWKGAPAKTVDVVTIDEGSLCGFGFERGKSYLLFTPEAHGTLSVNLCSRSKTSDLAAADFAELDRLAKSDTEAPAPSASVERPAPAPALPDAASAAFSPSPVAPPAPSVAAEPRRGGCGGCSSTPVPGSIGAELATVLALLASHRRRRRQKPPC